jgi:hypothetical protein
LADGVHVVRFGDTIKFTQGTRIHQMLVRPKLAQTRDYGVASM